MEGLHSGSQDPWMLAWKAKCSRLYFKGSFTDGPLDVVLQEIKFQEFEWPFQLLGQISSVGACQREREKKRGVIDRYMIQLTASGKTTRLFHNANVVPVCRNLVNSASKSFNISFHCSCYHPTLIVHCG